MAGRAWRQVRHQEAGGRPDWQGPTGCAAATDSGTGDSPASTDPDSTGPASTIACSGPRAAARAKMIFDFCERAHRANPSGLALFRLAATRRGARTPYLPRSLKRVRAEYNRKVTAHRLP